jgi:cysteinyl-tRNA synthetase
VLFPRVQAASLAALQESGPEEAIGEINRGLGQFKDLFTRYDAVEQYDEDELVKRLLEMRESVRQRYELGRTLDEQLAEAIRAENYELAATIRDKILNDKIRSPSE